MDFLEPSVHDIETFLQVALMIRDLTLKKIHL